MPTLKPKLITIEELRPHPLQQVFFDADCAAADDKALREDLARRGHRDPIVVVPRTDPDGETVYLVLDGHRRLRFLQELGHTQIAAVIRKDLVNVSDSDLEKEFLSFNFQRRQLRPLGRIRILRRQFEIERKTTRLGPHAQAMLLERLAVALGMSPRNVNRYLRVLDAPREIQHLVDLGHLRLTYGARVAGLSPDKQQAIAAAVQATEPEKVNPTVATLLQANSGRHCKAGDALAAFARSLDRGVNDVADRTEILSPRLIARHAAPLRRARAVIDQLLGRTG